MRTVLLLAVVIALWLFLDWMSRGAATQASGVYGPGEEAQPGADNDADNGLGKIVQAVIHAESGGRQTDSQGNTLRSKAGALGIMQLMPSTAAQLGVDPNDEEQNVKGGTEYLDMLFHKYGNWFDALSAYNWGPGNVDRAQAAGQPYPKSVTGYATKILGSI